MLGKKIEITNAQWIAIEQFDRIGTTENRIIAYIDLKEDFTARQKVARRSLLEASWPWNSFGVERELRIPKSWGTSDPCAKENRSQDGSTRACPWHPSLSPQRTQVCRWPLCLLTNLECGIDDCFSIHDTRTSLTEGFCLLFVRVYKSSRSTIYTANLPISPLNNYLFAFT